MKYSNPSWRNLFTSLFRKAPIRMARRPGRACPRLETLEDRTVPALAHTAALTLQGVAGTLNLSSNGGLIFTAGNVNKTLEPISSAFNVDAAGNLFELNSNANLWELPAGADPTMIGPGGWRFLDSNVGSFSLSATGVLEELKMNGNVWRFANGAYDALPLATGAGRADVDALGNVYALVNGNLKKFAPGQNAGVTLNDGAVAGSNAAGNVVSFSVGGNTVAWMLGLQDTLSALIEVSYTNGTAPTQVTDSNAGGLLAVYAVAADGSVLVADPGAGTNTGVTLLTIGQFDVDTNGTDLPVNATSQAGTSFQLSPDGTAVAVLDAAGGNLSAYRIVNNALGAEQKLETGGLAQSFGIANDLKVYELTNTATLQFYDPFGLVPVLTPTLVSATVSQWQLGPDGEVAYLTTAGAFHVGTQTVAGVTQLAVAPNGQLYYLANDGSLFQGTGDPFTPGTYDFDEIDMGVAAISVSNNSALLDVKQNGRVWRLTGSPDDIFSISVAPVSTIFNGWVPLYTNATLGANPGAKQAVGADGTALFTLPDGAFFFLISGQFTRLNPRADTVFAVGQTDLDWESNPNTRAGSTTNVPAFNPLLGSGTFFSAMIGVGLNPVPLTLF